MFGFSFWEIGIIMVIALVVLGPKKLPELAKSLGKGLREFRKATEDFKGTFDDEAYKPDPIQPPKPAAGALPNNAAKGSTDVEAEIEPIPPKAEPPPKAEQPDPAAKA